MPFDEADVRSALQDRSASMVLQACIGRASSAKDISASTGLPVVTVYRHVKRLTAQGLLLVERSAKTATGKPYDLYRCPLEWVALFMTGDGFQVRWRAERTMSERLHGLWKQMEERK